jgi:hypothetical protein
LVDSDVSLAGHVASPLVLGGRLRQIPLVALLVDGVHCAEHVVLAAVGVDDRGTARLSELDIKSYDENIASKKSYTDNGRTTLGRPTLHLFRPLLLCHLPARSSLRPRTIVPI